MKWVSQREGVKDLHILFMLLTFQEGEWCQNEYVKIDDNDQISVIIFK